MEPSPAQAQAQPIPPELSQLVQVNTQFGVLICVGNGCRYALRPAAICRHLEIKHKTPLALRKQVVQYIRGFPFSYEHFNVPLPIDGSAPQPIIPVVNGFACWDCPFKTQSRVAMRQHGNQAHKKKRVADEEMFKVVRMQSWFGEKRERYWVVDESQQAQQERQARRAAIEDVGEALEPSPDRNSNGEDSQDDIDPIVQEIEQWKADMQERRLRALANVPVVEMDSWLQYTGWNAVLHQSKHNMVKTAEFAHEPSPDETALSRVVRAWKRILERCLDTLEATDQKDALKWWKSPKNEAADQHPFELPQNGKSMDKYSAVWERCICYMMRTAPKEHWDDETGTCRVVIPQPRRSSLTIWIR